MASKYAKPMVIPTDFPDILRDFAREALRQQGKVETKEEIYAFGSQYFKELVEIQSSASNAVKDVVTDAVAPVYVTMEEIGIKKFVTAALDAVQDQDGNMIGFKHFKQVLDGVGEQLQLSPIELKALYAEADENEGGYINRADFLPMGIEALLRLRANYTQRLARSESFRKHEVEFILHGMMQDDMESILQETFQRADNDEVGEISRPAFMDALRDADLGFTRREINILMSEAPASENDANMARYSDFTSIWYPLMKDVYAHGVLETQSDPDCITQYLNEVFASRDDENTGLLTVAELARLLRAADIGLTRLQIVAVMAEAEVDIAGFINYEKFTDQISKVVLKFTDIDSQQTFASDLQRYRKTSEYYTVMDLNQLVFEQILSRAFDTSDETGRGILTRDQVVGAIRNALPEITDRQLRSLLVLSAPNEKGEIDINLIIHSAFQALQKLQEFDIMMSQ